VRSIGQHRKRRVTEREEEEGRKGGKEILKKRSNKMEGERAGVTKRE